MGGAMKAEVRLRTGAAATVPGPAAPGSLSGTAAAVGPPPGNAPLRPSGEQALRNRFAPWIVPFNAPEPFLRSLYPCSLSEMNA